VCIASAWLREDDLARRRLVHVAPPWAADPLPVCLVYPQARFYAARLRRFIDGARFDALVSESTARTAKAAE
jgi:DNA-binding transcriptional LysR family regulator